MTIDMKEFSGELIDSAAEGQQIGHNSYQNEAQFEAYPVDQGLLDQIASEKKPSETPVSSAANAVEEQSNKQELNFKAFREEMDQKIAQIKQLEAEREAERQEFKQNLDLLKANVAQQRIPQEAPKSNKMFDGMADDDVPSVSEIRKAWEQRELEYQGQLEELTVAQQNPDYAEVLQKYTAPLLKQKPHLAEGIQGARNKALFAYELGKLWQQQQIAQAPQPPAPTSPPPQPSVNAQRIIENAQKPGSLSSAGGQGALSKAEYFSTMSDAEFMKMATKNLGEI